MTQSQFPPPPDPQWTLFNPADMLPAYGATSDAQASGRTVIEFKPPQPPRYREYRKRSVDPQTGMTTAYWELTFTDLRGPTAYNGSLKDVGHGAQPDTTYALTPLDRRYPGVMALPPKTYTTTVTNGWGSAGPVCHAAIFNVVVGAIGGTANEALFTITPGHTSDHDIAAIAFLTYTPGAVILNVNALRMDAVATPRLAVGRTGAVIEWFSDAASPPTSLGADHANTSSCWWICEASETAAVSGSQMFNAGNAVYTRAIPNPVATAPTGALQFRGGGWGGWKRQLRGESSPKVYAIEPMIASATSVIGTSALTRLVAIATDASSYTAVNSPLKTFTVGGPFQDEFFFSDGKSAFLYDGERWLLMNWRSNLPGDVTIEGYWEDDKGIYLLTRQWNSDATLYVRGVVFWDAAANTAYPVQVYRTDTSQILMAPGPMPKINEGTTGNGGSILWPVRVTNDMRWQEQWAPPAGYVPYWHSDGRPDPPPANYAMGFEDSGGYTGPYTEIEGLEGYEKVTDGIWCGGNINDAGSAATAGYAEISYGGYTVRFTADGEHDYPRTNYYGPTEGNGRFYQGQLTVTVARTTADENYTPQILPIIVRGRAFLPPVGPEPDAPGVGVYEPYDGSGFLAPGIPDRPKPQPRRRRNG